MTKRFEIALGENGPLVVVADTVAMEGAFWVFRDEGRSVVHVVLVKDVRGTPKSAAGIRAEADAEV